jgi:arsenite-transporting ATPase
VGKSTSSALTAVHLAAAGRRTLLVSMDPAHNQRDIFDTPFSEKPRPVADGLSVKEIDTDYWTSRYLKQTRDQIKRTYAYQSAFNLQDHFNVLRIPRAWKSMPCCSPSNMWSTDPMAMMPSSSTWPPQP